MHQWKQTAAKFQYCLKFKFKFGLAHFPPPLPGALGAAPDPVRGAEATCSPTAPVLGRTPWALTGTEEESLNKRLQEVNFDIYDL